MFGSILHFLISTDMSFSYLEEQGTPVFREPSHDMLASRPLIAGSVSYLEDAQSGNRRISMNSVQNDQ